METTILTVNNVWMMVCTALVFFMHLGFSFLEIGLTRQKNTINILFKNFFVITVGLLLYCIGGFNGRKIIAFLSSSKNWNLKEVSSINSSLSALKSIFFK